MVPVVLRLIPGRADPFAEATEGGAVDLSMGNPGSGISSSTPPNPCRLAFSCLFCTLRKCERSSDHLISSRPSLDRVDETLETLLYTTASVRNDL